MQDSAKGARDVAIISPKLPLGPKLKALTLSTSARVKKNIIKQRLMFTLLYIMRYFVHYSCEMDVNVQACKNIVIQSCLFLNVLNKS